MIRIGEESSRLPLILRKLERHYDAEITYQLTTFTQILEPALIVSLGIIIGGLIVAIYLPLFQMVNQIPF
jgi:type IV pilus assembly protein PilC